MRHDRALILILVSAVVFLPGAGHAANVPGSFPGSSTPSSGGFGKVKFPVACAAGVRAAFDVGVAQLHNFQYEQSSKTFKEVARQDPQCAMAYWGQAMSLYHQLWDWPSASTLKTGWQLIEKAQQASEASARERAYIRAAAAYFQNNPKLDDEARAVAYSQALAELHQRYPGDDNGAAFYALSLIAIRTPDKANEMAHRRQAIAILQKLFVQDLDNPGVAHYLIHASDTPVLAHLGLAAARRYAKIAPDSAHALHMPSHIFTDLGLWQESIDSNLASAAAARKATTSGEYNASGHQLHAQSFLEYAYLQSGRNRAARQVIGEIKTVPGAEPADIRDTEALFQAEYDTENHDWKQAAALAVPAGMWAGGQAQMELARAIGAARSGNAAAARQDIQKLVKAQAAMGGGRRYSSRPSHAAMDRLMAESWLAYAEGNSDQALSKMKSAARLEGQAAWREGEGGVQISAREMLADLLMELHQPQKALAHYQVVLKQSPNRFDALYGAAQAAQAQGNAGTAQQYLSELTRICGPAAERPELEQARRYLAKK